MANTNPILSSGLTSYVEEHASDLLVRSVLDGKSRRAFNLITDVKGPTTLNIMDNEIEFKELDCNWDPQGSTEFSQRVLTPAALEVQIPFCDKNLLKTWAQYQVKIAAGMETLPFEEKWTNDLVAKVNEKIEKMIYQGNAASTATTEFDGLITILSDEASVVSYESTTGATAYEFLKGVAASIPVQVKNPVILCSTPLYREFMQDLVAANLFHFDPGNGENEYRLPGTDIKVVAVDGLVGADEYAIAANMNNLYYGCNLESDDATFDLWYSKDNREFRFDLAFVAGVQVAFPDEVVLGVRQ